MNIKMIRVFSEAISALRFVPHYVLFMLDKGKLSEDIKAFNKPFFELMHGTQVMDSNANRPKR